MSTTKPTGLDLLREPFPAHQISKLPKPYKSDSPKSQCKECGGYHGQPAVHLDYVGHAALTDRLLDADPNWTWEPLGFTPDGLPATDKSGGLWIKLTVCGLSRLGYGHAGTKTGGDAVKEMIGDALRNAAMRFGAALDLWHKGQLHADEDDEKPEPVAAPIATKPPTGYADWADDMATMARELDINSFRGRYKASKRSYREFLETHDKPVLEALIARAYQNQPIPA